MKFIYSLEKKLGRYAIKNISLYLIICYAFGYLIAMANPAFLNFLTLNPYLIITKGQVWRLFSWILIAPASSNIFFTLITLYFYYSIGSTLERTWGTFVYNLYLFCGMLFTVIGSFALLFYAFALGGFEPVFLSNNASVLASYFSLFSTYYINMSILLAFAITFPENQVLLFFIIPVKIKWIGMIYGGFLVMQFIFASVPEKFVILASLLNFIIFFFLLRKKKTISIKQMKRRHEYQKEVKVNSNISRHKCAICGRTEQDGEHLEFRYCSKCEGNYEYCSEHLFTHEHVQGNRKK